MGKMGTTDSATAEAVRQREEAERQSNKAARAAQRIAQWKAATQRGVIYGE